MEDVKSSARNFVIEDSLKTRLAGFSIWITFTIGVPILPLVWVHFRLRNEHRAADWWPDVIASGDLLAVALVLPLAALAEVVDEIRKNTRNFKQIIQDLVVNYWLVYQIYYVPLAHPWQNRRQLVDSITPLLKLLLKWLINPVKWLRSPALPPMLRPIQTALVLSVLAGAVFAGFMRVPTSPNRGAAISVVVYLCCAVSAWEIHQLAGKIRALDAPLR